MGRRGRQKAKQTRVARELKYSSGPTDLERLARELAAERQPGDPLPPVVQAGLADDDEPNAADPDDDADTDDDADDVDYHRYSAYGDDDDQPANGTYSR